MSTPILLLVQDLAEYGPWEHGGDRAGANGLDYAVFCREHNGAFVEIRVLLSDLRTLAALGDGWEREVGPGPIKIKADQAREVLRAYENWESSQEEDNRE